MDPSGLDAPYVGTDQDDGEALEDDSEEYTEDECSCCNDEGYDEGADEYNGFDCFAGFYGMYYDRYEPDNVREIRRYEIFAFHCVSNSVSSCLKTSMDSTEQAA